MVDAIPGAIATNFGCNSDPAVIAGILRASGIEVQFERGERLPDEALEKPQPLLKSLLDRPEDVGDIVSRPPKSPDLAP